MNKPESYIDWMPNNSVNDPDPKKIIKPSIEKHLAGWLADERPPNQYWNWFYQIVGKWVRYFDKSSYHFDAVIGSTADCTHEFLSDAAADVDLGEDVSVLLREGAELDETITLTKAGWRIYSQPGVTFTKGAAATAFSLEAPRIEIHSLRFAGFSASGDKAIVVNNDAWYCRILNSNFFECDTPVDDDLAPAGKKPVLLGNISEV